MNKLDSFNKDKIKCQKCKEYFDRFLTSWASILSVTLCKDCDEEFGHYWDEWRTKPHYTSRRPFEQRKLLKISFEEFLNEQT
jgi:hypothetical protein